jgi:hypothetical protein
LPLGLRGKLRGFLKSVEAFWQGKVHRGFYVVQRRALRLKVHLRVLLILRADILRRLLHARQSDPRPLLRISILLPPIIATFVSHGHPCESCIVPVFEIHWRRLRHCLGLWWFLALDDVLFILQVTSVCILMIDYDGASLRNDVGRVACLAHSRSLRFYGALSPDWPAGRGVNARLTVLPTCCRLSVGALRQLLHQSPGIHCGRASL